jgi:hypothetical protein
VPEKAVRRVQEKFANLEALLVQSITFTYRRLKKNLRNLQAALQDLNATATLRCVTSDKHTEFTFSDVRAMERTP